MFEETINVLYHEFPNASEHEDLHVKLANDSSRCRTAITRVPALLFRSTIMQLRTLVFPQVFPYGH
jgi:hypothetical protein